jgi:hypothetical protein
VHRDGNDLKQIAGVLDAGGEPTEWFAQAIEPTNGVVDRIDMTVADGGRRSVAPASLTFVIRIW